MKRLSYAIAVGLIGVTACSDQTGIGLNASPDVRFEVVSGSDQQGEPHGQLPAPLVVRVVNGSGQPVARQIVNFVVTGGGGSVFAGANMTNTNGIAQEWWTLGPSEGMHTLEVRGVN